MRGGIPNRTEGFRDGGRRSPLGRERFHSPGGFNGRGGLYDERAAAMLEEERLLAARRESFGRPGAGSLGIRDGFRDPDPFEADRLRMMKEREAFGRRDDFGSRGFIEDERRAGYADTRGREGFGAGRSDRFMEDERRMAFPESRAQEGFGLSRGMDLLREDERRMGFADGGYGRERFDDRLRGSGVPVASREQGGSGRMFAGEANYRRGSI